MMRQRTMRNKASLGWLHHFDLWPLLSKWSRSESILGYESAILEFWTFNLWIFHKLNSYRNLISMRETWKLFTFCVCQIVFVAQQLTYLLFQCYQIHELVFIPLFSKKRQRRALIEEKMSYLVTILIYVTLNKCSYQRETDGQSDTIKLQLGP